MFKFFYSLFGIKIFIIFERQLRKIDSIKFAIVKPPYLLYCLSMKNAFVRLFAQPVFNENEKNRLSKLIVILVLLINLLIILRLLSLVLLLPEHSARWFSTMAFVSSFSIFLLLLVKKGKIKIAAYLFCYVQLILVFVLAYSGGGIRGETITNLPFLILSTALILGWRKAVYLGLLAILGCVGLYLMEVYQLLPDSEIVRSSVSIFINTLMQIFLLSILQFMALNNLDFAFEEAKKELELRKHTELSLRQSESFRQRIFESSSIPIVIMDSETFRYMDCNEAAVAIYRMKSKDQTMKMTPFDVSNSTQYDGTKSEIKAIEFMNEARAKGSVEFEWLHRYETGELWDAFVHLMCFESENKTYFQFILTDITARKKAEKELEKYQLHLETLVQERTEELNLLNEELEDKIKFRAEEIQESNLQLESTILELFNNATALQESEERYLSLINNVMYPVIVSNYDGDILFVNQKAAEFNIYNREDAFNFWANINQRQEYIEELIANGFIRNKEVQIQNGNKEVISVIMSSNIIKYYDQQAVLTIYNDITKQKQLEQKILTTTIETEEKERQYFAMELHDGIGPLLSAIKMYLQWIEQSDGKPNMPQLINKTIGLVDEAYKTSKEISRKLSPHILRDFGFFDALKNLIEQTSISKQLTITISDDFEKHAKTFSQMNMQHQTILYRVFSELINNTIKHAQASQINISMKQIENKLEFFYNDNGIGFDINEMEEKKSGLGLLNIKNRIEAINGVFSLASIPGEGTFIIIQMVLNN